MQYNAPYGVTDPNAPYINGNPTIALQGSIPPASSIEFPQREIVGVIQKSKFTPSNADLLQLAKAIRSKRLNYCEDTGSVNTLSVALDPPLEAYTLGLDLHVRIRNRTTGPTTIDAGCGRTNVVRMDGSSIGDGDLPASAVATLRYDGQRFQVVNFLGVGGAGGGVTTYLTKLPYAVDVGTVAGQIIANFSPAITALAAGDAVLVKLANTLPGGTTTLKVNALAPIGVQVNGGHSVLQGDAIVGDVMFMRYDGTNFYIDAYPMITASTTLNVPSQYSTVTNALTALKRKLIQPGVIVTIQIAGGATSGSPAVIAPFNVDHQNQNCIVIKGTMFTPGSVPWNGFSFSGSDGASRAHDSAVNIGILRSRYGTEVQVPANQYGISNSSSSGVTFQDILITGPNYNGCQSYGVFGNGVTCNNVAVWGCQWGITAAGNDKMVQCNGCSCVSNFSHGYYAETHGQLSVSNSNGHSNGTYGFLVNQNSFGGGTTNFFLYNGKSALSCAHESYLTQSGVQSIGSAETDQACSVNSEILNQSAANPGSQSPSPGTFGNYNAIILNV